MRRSLVLTDESARHPLRARMPHGWRRSPVEVAPARADMGNPRYWLSLTAHDMRGFASTYFAALAAMLAYLF